MAHYDGFVESEKINFQRAEIERLQRDLVSEVSKERQMWKNAIAIVLAKPEEIGLIGDPSKDNDVREALRPVASLQREHAELREEIASLKSFALNYEHATKLDRQDAKDKLAAAELDRDAWVEQHHNRTKLIDDLQAKLAAAEADTKRLNWCFGSLDNGASSQNIERILMFSDSLEDARRLIDTAIDAAKTEPKA